MGALLIGTQFLFTAVRRRPGRVDVLNCARGAAKQYWSSFFGVDFAKAALPNLVITNQTFVWPSVAELRCIWFMVMGGVHNPVLSCGATFTPGWAFDDETSVRRSFLAGWTCQANAYSTLRTTIVITMSGCIGFTGKRVGFWPEWPLCSRCRSCAGTDFHGQNRSRLGPIEFRTKGLNRGYHPR